MNVEPELHPIVELAVRRAGLEARMLRHEPPGSGHLLVALAARGYSFDLAHQLLRARALNRRRMRRIVRIAVEVQRVSYPEVRIVVGAAVEIAKNDSRIVYLSHLLLAMLDGPDRFARDLLEESGVSIAELRDELNRRRREFPPSWDR